jgi:hypothetical protein
MFGMLLHCVPARVWTRSTETGSSISRWQNTQSAACLGLTQTACMDGLRTRCCWTSRHSLQFYTARSASPGACCPLGTPARTSSERVIIKTAIPAHSGLMKLANSVILHHILYSTGVKNTFSSVDSWKRNNSDEDKALHICSASEDMLATWDTNEITKELQGDLGWVG